MSRPIPSQFNPVPSLPQSCPRSHGGSVIQSRPNISSPVPIAVPFNRKCPDRTFVRRKSLPGQDYGRTPSSGPDSPGPDRLRVPTVPHSCPVPDLGLWTLDLGYLKSRPRPVRPVPINPVPIRSHPGRIRPLIARTAQPLPVAERHLGAAQPRVPILRSCDVPAKPLAGRDQSMGRLARAVSPPVGTPTSRDEPSAAAVLMD